jgi:hypothetical protein
MRTYYNTAVTALLYSGTSRLESQVRDRPIGKFVFRDVTLCWLISTDVKMDRSAFDTSVRTYKTTWRNTPEDFTLPQYRCENFKCYVVTFLVDMDMSYTRVLHIKVAYRTSQMTSRLLRNTVAAMRAHNVLCKSYNTRPLLWARITCYVTVITVEINHCSFRRVRFALLYIATLSKIV